MTWIARIAVLVLVAVSVLASAALDGGHAASFGLVGHCLCFEIAAVVVVCCEDSGFLAIGHRESC